MKDNTRDDQPAANKTPGGSTTSAPMTKPAAATTENAATTEPSAAPDAGISVKDYAAWCLDFINDEDWAERIADLRTPEKEVALKHAGFGEITAFVQELRHVAAKRAHILRPAAERIVNPVQK